MVENERQFISKQAAYFNKIIFANNTHTRLMALFRDYPGEPVPER